MSTSYQKFYEKGTKFINSRTGIMISVVSALCLLVMFSWILWVNIERKRTFFVIFSVCYLVLAVFSLIGSFKKLKKLKEKAGS